MSESAKKQGTFLTNPVFWVFLVALVLRLLGVRWGLPNPLRNFSLHPDEMVNLLYARQIVPGQFKFTPGFYNYGTLYLTLLRFLSDIVGTYGGGFQENGNLTPQGIAQIHLAGRILNCFFGAALAGVTCSIGLRFLKPVASIAAGALVAVAPSLIVHSDFQTVDMLAALLVMLAVRAALRIVEITPSTDVDRKAQHDPELLKSFQKWVLTCSVMAGLAAGTKYVGFVSIVGLYVALLISSKTHGWSLGSVVKYSILGTIVALISFVISTPGVLLETQAFLRDFTFEMNHSREGHGLVFAETAPAVLYHVSNLAIGFSLIATVVGIAGLVWSIARKDENGQTYRPHAIVILSVGLIYFLAVSTGQIKFMRYILPLIPILALGAGLLLNQVENLKGNRLAMIVAIALVGGIDRGALSGAAQFIAQMQATDPRDAAAQFLKKEGATEVGFANDPWFWSVSVHPDVPATRMAGRNRLIEMWTGWTNPKVVRFVTPDPAETPDWDPRLVTESAPQYIAFSSLEYASVERLVKVQSKNRAYSDLISRYQLFVKELTTKYEKVWDNDPQHTVFVEDMEYVRPRVVIWKKKG